MIRPRSFSSVPQKTGLVVLCVTLALVIVTLSTAVGLCAEVAYATARRVAERKLAQHVALYGAWNAHAAPQVAGGEAVRYEDRVVAYNFPVNPSGHVLVAVDDAFSPVLLYSERARFNPERAFDPAAIESWIVPELDQRVRALFQFRRAMALQESLPALSLAGTRIKAAWDDLNRAADQRLAAVDAPPVRTAGIGPLLTTAWGQATPYNLMTPAGSTCTRTQTGCVATAWAQLMRYHQWPEQGTGSHAYPWKGTILQADFNVRYPWDLMPGSLAGSRPEQQNAVALVMRDVGIAAETAYGCSESSSYAYADDVLDTYFKYKAMERVSRSAVSSSDAWLDYFRTEFSAGRPLILSIFVLGAPGGHEAVADGYQDDATDLIHLNYGWEGYQDGWYNITTSFEAGGPTWAANSQVIVIGIEPDRGRPPEVDAGEPQTVDEGTVAHLTGRVAEGTERYQWLQVGVGDATPMVALRNPDTSQASFTAPQVSADTQLVFMLKATTISRSVGFDKVFITVRDTGPSSSSPSSPKEGGRGSGGGCFIATLF